ncbi:MAG: sigma-70 family RNA polymerase sigma factor [Chitinophagales bacterium]|jgi:RNA polymerase sigma factor (sigma-70 family)|nr:sigma-70 family RNA polymerase sigma factor [Chitinophagales bacterium]MDA9952240.1 sigma-70 family RNA polymerase sigma factor [Chitinophagales bacterium]|tara:strand:+ start:210 stop:785 length:576 start_codon:yes stop_codon:yes gene_type:complete
MRKIKTDQELVREYLTGSENALEHLITRHKEKVFTSIIIFTKDRYLAEDLFQDTFIKVINKLKAGKYKEEGKFLPWVMRISYNICIDHYRKTKRSPKVVNTEGFDIFDILPLSQESPEQLMMGNQSKDKVRKLLEELPEEQKEVVLLRHYYDFSFKEIAELTGVSINTALGRMRYSLINLRKVIEEKQIQL